ncbi:MAG TPA: asparagine synthase (glutamine-hydrolyzing) [Thermoanaerobaculaceae bacterium]|nr:asparagine synthase (glutamine-hydrolyzing) [Thermoanaerobaculaceae bacterium]
MCGIAGIFAYDPRAGQVDRAELRAVRDAMRLRGPDGHGEWFSADGRVGFGHRRLSIIDLSDAAAQPMVADGGNYAIVFNGEIYNFRDLRARLEAEGRRFSTASDTEVLLEMYRTRGAAMLAELRGMFAFALWDGPNRRMLLARDLYGVKPLYIAAGGGVVRVASQVKALLAGGRVSRRQDPAGVAGFFLRGAVPEPFTLYEGVRALPAGSFVWVGERGVSEAEAFASVPALLANAVEHAPPLSEEELQDGFRRAFLDSVRYHLVADVRVGMFLSSGRDSTSTVALAREAGATDLRTVTLTFSEYQGSRRDEAPLAEEVARHYGTDHSTVMISKADFIAEFPHVIEAMDQPTTDAVNSYFVSLAAARCGLKVALSGTGGDELLGGYGTYRKVPMMVKLARVPSKLPLLPEALHRAYLALTPKWSTHISQKHGAILKYGGSYAGAYFLKRAVFMPWDLPELMGAEAARAGLERLDMIGLIEKALTPDPRQPFLRMVSLESCIYMRDQLLRDIDWASMAHSLEVRVPLVEHHLLRAVAPLLVHARGNRKLFLARSPAGGLPPAVYTRGKTGFSVPVREWMLGGERGGKGREFGRRGWARHLYDTAFRPDGGI